MLALASGLALTPQVQTWLTTFVANRVLEPSGIRIELDRLHVRPNGHISIESARLFDSADEQAAEIRSADIRVRVGALFSHTVSIDRATVSGADVTLTDSILEDLQQIPRSPERDTDWSVSVVYGEIESLELRGIPGLNEHAFSVEASGFEYAGGHVSLADGRVEHGRDYVELQFDGRPPELSANLTLSVSRDTIGGLSPEAARLMRPADRIDGSVSVSVTETEWAVTAARFETDTDSSVDFTARLDADATQAEVEIDSIEHAGYRARGRAVLHMTGDEEARLELAVTPELDAPELQVDVSVSHLFGPTVLDIQESDRLFVQGAVELGEYARADFEAEPVRARAQADIDIRSLPAFFTDLFPVVPEVQSLTARLAIDDSTLDITAALDAISGAGYVVQTLELAAEGEPDAFEFMLEVDEIAVAQASVFETSLSGAFESGELRISGETRDQVGEALFATEILLSIGRDWQEFTASFTDSGLEIRGGQWSIPETNRITFRDGSIGVEDMRLEQAEASIRIVEGTEPDSITVEVENLNLADQLPVELEFPLAGYVDASATGALNPEPWAELAVEIRDLELDSISPGHLELTVSARETIAGELVYTQEDGSLTAGFQLDLSAEDIALDIDLSSIDAGLLAAFAAREIEDSDGTVSGSLRVSGSLDAPEFAGSIELNDVHVSPRRLGTRFGIQADSLEIAGRSLSIEGLALIDESQNSMSLSGSIELALSPEDIRYDLRLEAEDFTLLETEAAANPELYGTVVMSAGMSLTGNIGDPVLEGSVSISSGTDVTVVLPRAGLQQGRGEGVVRFEGDLVDELLQTETEPLIQGISLTGSLSIASDAHLNLVIDPRTGDRLQIRGGGDFSLGVERSGAIDLAGVFTVEEGSYELQFLGLVERSFDIVPGGSITWSGDFEDAELDLAARYTTRTSPAPILADTEEAVPAGNLPVLVVLDLAGTLIEPEISLSLDMPEDEQNALGGRPYTAIQNINLQESQRNTQAFALVVLNQFFRSDIAALDETAVFTSGARGSLSELLTTQLNVLSQQVLPGLDLAFDIDSFEEATEEGAAGRTEVQIQLSQQLFDDRVVVRFGGQFDVEQTTEAADVGTDASVEYALTEDGQFRIRAFFERSPGADDEGTVTGLSFVFGRDFDPFPSPGEDDE